MTWQEALIEANLYLNHLAQGVVPHSWYATVRSKVEPGLHACKFGFGQGLSPDEAVLAAIDYLQNPKPAYTPKPRPSRTPVIDLDIGDIEI